MATWDDILDARSVFIGDIEAMTKDNTDVRVGDLEQRKGSSYHEDIYV